MPVRERAVSGATSISAIVTFQVGDADVAETGEVVDGVSRDHLVGVHEGRHVSGLFSVRTAATSWRWRITNRAIATLPVVSNVRASSTSGSALRWGATYEGFST